MVMPTQVVFDPTGKEVTRHIGYWPKDEFLAALAKAGLK
jgi:thioredoxin-related protein